MSLACEDRPVRGEEPEYVIGAVASALLSRAYIGATS